MQPDGAIRVEWQLSEACRNPRLAWWHTRLIRTGRTRPRDDVELARVKCGRASWPILPTIKIAFASVIS